MFSKNNSSVTIDLLFNLLLTFVCLFFLSFLLVNDPSEDNSSDVDSDSKFIITMTWEEDCDIDLWLKLPTGERVYYGRRESGPVHLDLDVVATKSYTDREGKVTLVSPNQEILTIRGVLEGDYSLSAHYFGGRDPGLDVVVTFVIQDVERRDIAWAGEVTLNGAGHEVSALSFNIKEANAGISRAYFRVLDTSPRYIVGQ